MADTVFIPDDGIAGICGLLIASGAWWDGKKIRLFQNNITPSDASVIGDFTEATFTGYAAATIAAASFGAVTVASHVASSTYANVTFTRSTTGASQSLYGFYITDFGATKVYAAARFSAAPLVLTNSGDNIALTSQATTVQSVN